MKTENEKPHWTKPYYGVTHLIVPRTRFQYSIEDYREYVPKDVGLEDSYPVSAMRIGIEPGQRTLEKYFKTVDEAKTWLEKLYHQNNG